jgi:RNA polymerase sigma factor (sigma-70 family)
MVLASAQRLLGNSSDAEDAFQATFLTLALKASSIRNTASLGGWLHQVVCRAANRIRRIQARQPSLQPPAPHDFVAPETPTPGDLAIDLDSEIERLPERFRRAVVLHYLEGRSTEEVAAMLGCPRGTVLSRLASARKMLQRRLERRGTAVAIVAALSAAAPRTVRGELVAAVAPIAIEGTNAIRPNIVSLAHGVIRTMFWHKCRIPAVLALFALACLVAINVGRAAKPEPQQPPNQPAAPREDKPAAPDAEVAKIEALLKERRENLKEAFEKQRLRQEQGMLMSPMEELVPIQDRLLEVELELSHTPKERMEAYDRALKKASDLQKMVAARVAAGQERSVDDNVAKDNLLKLQIAMLKEKMRQQGK